MNMTEKLSWHKTHCARMDHGGCAIQVGVRNNQIVEIKGDPEGFLNQGYICPKGTASPQRLTHPLRLKQPLRRKGSRGEGKWQTISWDEAIAYISDKLQGVKEIDDSAIVLRIKYKTRPGDQFAIKRKLYKDIQIAFAENGIEFAPRKVIVQIPETPAESKGELTSEQKMKHIGTAAAETVLESSK